MAQLSQQEQEQLMRFMRGQVTSLRKSVRNIWIVATVLILFMVGYMSFIYNALLNDLVREALNPTALATDTTALIENNYLTFIEETDQLLRDQAYDVVNELALQFEEGVPAFRLAAEDAIVASYSEALPALSDEMELLLREYVRLNQATIEELIDTQEPEVAAREFADAALDNFATELDRKMRAEFEGRGLGYVADNVRTTILSMDQTLTELLSTPPEEMTRRQELQRRLLARMTATVTGLDPQPQE